MSQTTIPDPEPVEEAVPEPPAEDKATRRLLYFLVGLLGIAAIALLVLLFWLLRPKPEAPTNAAAGYPLVPVRSLLAWGGDLQNDALAKPLGTAFDDKGDVWVADTGNGRVLVFSPDGASLRQVGADPGPGKLTSPYGMAFDPAGDRVYVADWQAGKIQVYKSDGTFVTSFPNASVNPKKFGTGGFFPYDVRIVGGRIVAANANGLFFFDQSGNLAAQWGTAGRGIGYTQFNFPDAIAVDPSIDRLYVADTLNKRVVALNSDAKVQWIIGRPDKAGQIKGFWQLPKGLAIGPDHNIYVVDTFRATEKGVGDGHIVVISPDGRLLSAFGRFGQEEDALQYPDHLDYNGDGLWAIADRENNRVLLFKLTPIPEASQENQQLYAASVDTGPFPKALGPAMGPWEVPEAPAKKASGGWVLIVLAVILLGILYWLWRRRKARRAEAEQERPSVQEEPVPDATEEVGASGSEPEPPGGAAPE